MFYSICMASYWVAAKIFKIMNSLLSLYICLVFVYLWAEDCSAIGLHKRPGPSHSLPLLKLPLECLPISGGWGNNFMV